MKKSQLNKRIMYTAIILCFLGGGISLPVMGQEFTEDSVEADDLNMENIPRAPVPQSEEKEFTYNPQGARDPFVPLVGPHLDDIVKPSGKEGLQISELALQGIQIGLGRTAIMMGSDGKAYGMREGDYVFDGKLVDITNDKVVFEKTIYDAFGREKEKKRIEIYLHRK